MAMSATRFSPHLAARLMPRRVGPAMSPLIMTRGHADRTPHLPNKSDTEGGHPLNLKNHGATRAVRIVVYGALGVAAIAETIFWCSWLWSKAFKRAADEPEQQT